MIPKKYRSLHLLPLLAIALLASAAAGLEEQTVVVALLSRDVAAYDSVVAAFEQNLQEQLPECVRLHRFYLPAGEDSGALLAEVRTLRPNLVLTLGTPATRLAQSRLGGLPQLFAMVLNPEENVITPPGVCMDIPVDIRVEMLARMLGDVSFGTLYSSASVGPYQRLSQAFARQGIELNALMVDGPEAFPRACVQLCRKVDCFVMLPDAGLFSPDSVVFLLREGLRRGIPVVGLSERYTQAGALVSFGLDYSHIGEQAALLWLRGAEGKYEKPSRIRFSLNLLTARQLRLRLPAEIVAEADMVIGR